MERISLKKCRITLEKGGLNYTDEEVLAIREFLYMIAELDYEVYSKERLRELEFEKGKQEEKILKINSIISK